MKSEISCYALAGQLRWSLENEYGQKWTYAVLYFSFRQWNFIAVLRTEMISSRHEQFYPRSKRQLQTNHRRSQDFLKGGSHCVKVRVLTRLSCRPPRRVLIQKKVLKKGLFNYGQDIVMTFSPPVVGWLKKACKRGVTGTTGPPMATPLLMIRYQEENATGTFNFLHFFAETRTKTSPARMQLLSIVVFTTALISLLFSVALSSPAPFLVDSKRSLEGLREIESRKEKRICGMSIICRPYVSTSW